MSPAMAHSGVIIGVDEEAVESRCSDKVDASSPNSNRGRHDAYFDRGAAPGRSLQESLGPCSLLFTVTTVALGYPMRMQRFAHR